jgi:hypothetical protein
MKKDVDFQDRKDEDRHMKSNMTSLEQWKLQHSIRRTAKMVAQVTAWFCRGEATKADVQRWEIELSRQCDRAAANGVAL